MVKIEHKRHHLYFLCNCKNPVNSGFYIIYRESPGYKYPTYERNIVTNGAFDRDAVE